MCQMDLMWVSSDTSIQSVPSVVYVSDCPGSLSTGTQASSGKSGPALTDARGLRESALEADKSYRVFLCWTKFFFQATNFDPRGWVKVQFRAQSPEPRPMAPGRGLPRCKAVAGKVKVAGA